MASHGPTLFFPVDTLGRGCDFGFGFGFSADLVVPLAGSARFEADDKVTAADTTDCGCDFGVGFGPDLLVPPAGSAALEAETAAAAGVGRPRTDEIGPLTLPSAPRLPGPTFPCDPPTARGR